MKNITKNNKLKIEKIVKVKFQIDMLRNLFQLCLTCAHIFLSLFSDFGWKAKNKWFFPRQFVEHAFMNWNIIRGRESSQVINISAAFNEKKSRQRIINVELEKVVISSLHSEMLISHANTCWHNQFFIFIVLVLHAFSDEGIRKIIVI